MSAVPLRAGRTEELKWEERLMREREAWERVEEKLSVVLKSARADCYKHGTEQCTDINSNIVQVN